MPHIIPQSRHSVRLFPLVKRRRAVVPAQTATQANIDRRRPLSAYSTEEYRNLHARFLARRQVPLLISSSHVRDMTRLADLIEKEGTVTPIDWLTQRRIERAKALLADTTLTIQKVAIPSASAPRRSSPAPSSFRPASRPPTGAGQAGKAKTMGTVHINNGDPFVQSPAPAPASIRSRHPA